MNFRKIFLAAWSPVKAILIVWSLLLMVITFIYFIFFADKGILNIGEQYPITFNVINVVISGLLFLYWLVIWNTMIKAFFKEDLRYLEKNQAMLFLAIGKRLQEYGFHSHYTTRDHDYIHDIFTYQKVKPASFGSYGGKSLEGKLLHSVKRVVQLAEHIIELDSRPVATISLSSPDASRVAFGLGIPLILMNDTAHSKPVAKLTFSLANYLLIPSSINPNDFIELGANPKIIHTYNGVDEVEYLSDENFDYIQQKRAQESERYLVFRPEESYAAYMKDSDKKPYLAILEEAVDSYDGSIIVFPRYAKQKEIIQEKFDNKVIIPEKGMYIYDLLAKADAVITGGGTMAREAALVGIPSVTYFWRHLEPQKYLEGFGFPSHSIQTLDDTKKLVKKICKKPSDYQKDTSKLITKLQKPSDVLIKLMKKDKQLGKYFN
ncbi:MAG: DUF354 domain-containing protein [Candidatus Heimdallarchaeota archaeon]